MKCKICGQDAPYFIDTYIVVQGKKKCHAFCQRHMIIMNVCMKLVINQLSAGVQE